MKSSLSLVFLFVLLLLASGLVWAQGARYAVQMEATPVKADAEARVNELRSKSVEAYIVKSNVPGKGIFFRVRAGTFGDMNAARKYGTDLVKRGVIPDFFVAPYEQPETAVAVAAPVKPAPTPAPVVAKNTPVSEPTKSAVPVAAPPKQTTPAPQPAAAASNPVPAAGGALAFARFQDPSIGYSFEYPSYWSGQPLDPKDAADQRVNAGAMFKSAEDSAFLNAIWNKLDKANSPENDNDLIVEIILKSMASGDGTQLKETSRKVVNENGMVKTFLDLKAAFQSAGQTQPLDFIGKAVIVRASKGILLVVAFYSKDAPSNTATIADRIIASVRPPE
jgi:hypothetical protein